MDFSVQTQWDKEGEVGKETAGMRVQIMLHLLWLIERRSCLFHLVSPHLLLCCAVLWGVCAFIHFCWRRCAFVYMSVCACVMFYKPTLNTIIQIFFLKSFSHRTVNIMPWKINSFFQEKSQFFGELLHHK